MADGIAYEVEDSASHVDHDQERSYDRLQMRTEATSNPSFA